MNQSENLVNMLENKTIVKVCGAYDSMSAKLVEFYGFDAVWAGSFAISAIHNVPDASILTMTEFFTAASNMAHACKIPVIADCDTGYGNATNVRYMVKKYENAGIAGICIEDKTFPKQNSLLEGGDNKLLSVKDFAAKILAANETKQNKAFAIIARIEALISVIGIEQALKRAYAYEKAGADLIVIHSKKITPEEIFEFSDSWKGSIPLVVIPTTYYSVNIDELIKHKIKMVIYANQTLRAAHFALSKLLKQMKNANNLSKLQNQMSSMDDIFKLQEMYEMKLQEKSIEEKLRKLGHIN